VPLPSPTPADPLVALDRLGVRVGARTVLQDITLSLARGECVRLLGAAGAGKSTLLAVVAGFVAPSAGSLTIGQSDPARLAPRAARALRRTVGLVPQDLLLLDDESVLLNVALPALLAGVPRAEATDRALRIVERVGLAADLGGVAAGGLSYSQRRQVALARALVNRPALLLLDEPTAHLAPEAASAFVQLIEQFVDVGVAALVATQGLYVATRARDLRLVGGRLA